MKIWDSVYICHKFFERSWRKMNRITKVRVDGYESNVLYCLQQSTIKTLPAKDYFSYQPLYNLVCCSIEMNNSLSYFESKWLTLMLQPSMKIAQIEKLLNLSKSYEKIYAYLHLKNTPIPTRQFCLKYIQLVTFVLT